ncbi:FAD/NAD(P)-binding domain-containing protein [Cutaneotrichosporon oleaginosum]|uniref:FAD/NAD(P)-binding domain-containing protein n=1 Tax=Cutaneotrichosporon oleaginosum TaxID=879819 RepID=A0A0J0XCK6_9TREE|nr:FAD/NAD(P)-binding domain-containing protein [Cutaneotrichosporon oleaginosum]KLT38800.1 FAD/NAD(P)-binding domain-containing protein [Cutaneotrichosporon oleaginosum]TXT06218.1 hypothetical protein COLE_05549 [Cutaneotrichosporon oleaginosum]
MTRDVDSTNGINGSNGSNGSTRGGGGGASAHGATRWDGDGSQPYSFPDITMGTRRRVRVISIGGGASAINLAFQFKTHMTDLEHVAYDRNPTLGGTWLENRYPGCACDVPSHSYQYSWAPWSGWKSFYSSSEQIYEYMNMVVDKFGLRGDFRTSHEVMSAHWDDEAAQWVVRVRGPDGEFEDRADFLFNGSGVLNKWKWPAIEGLHSFKGHLVHSAAWDQSYDFKDKKMAIIGAGSTAVQIVPVLQKLVSHMKCFIRSPVWITPAFAAQYAGPGGTNFDYTPEQKAEFDADPQKWLEYRKGIESSINCRYLFVTKGTPQAAEAKAVSKAQMEAKLASKPEIAKLLIPDFMVGCRRPTPGNGYLEALVADNVEVVSNPIVRVEERGLVTADGTLHEVDTIVCATGFDVSLKPRFPFTGRNGADLAKRWATEPTEAYMGVMVDEHPNYFISLGPSSPVAHGSILPCMEKMSHYIMKVIRKMQVEPIRAIAPSKAAVREFNEHRNSQLATTAWSDRCSSWFKNGTVDGPVVAVHPGSRLHYFEMIAEPRYEDMDIEYSNNRFAYLGNGRTRREVEGRDLAWYLESPYDVTLPYPDP